MLITNDYVFFYTNKDCFSNFYRCKFSVNGIDYNCSEQYMMYAKARLFGDFKTGEMILAECIPGKIKALGRQIANFNEKIWHENREKIMYDAVLEKFSQNKDLKQVLLETNGKILAEASPSDRIWGIGLGIDDSRIHNSNNWRGLNLLGVALMKARDFLLKN